MKRLNNTLLRTILLMVLPALSIGQAVGQNILKYNFAGDNQTVLYDCDAGYTTVTLGNPQEAPGANEDEVQYYWEIVSVDGPTDFTDETARKKPVTAVRITSEEGTGDFVFSLTRISKYGYQKEFVTVTMKNTIEVIVKPKNECWGDGDDITLDQFDIQTNPKGFVEHVILDQDSRKAKNHAGLLHDTQTLHFVSDDPSKYPVEQNETIINVIRAGANYGIAITGNPSTMGMIEGLRKGADLVEKLQKIEKATEPFKKFLPHGVPLELSFPCSVNINFMGGIECCNGGEAKYAELSGGGSVGVNFELNFPLPPCPVVHLFVGLKASLSLDVAGIRWTYHTECEDCDCGGVSLLNFKLGGQLYGGVSLEVGSRDFLSVSGVVTGGVDWGGKLFFPNEKQANQSPIQMDDNAHFYGKVGVYAVLLVTNFTVEATFAEN